MFYGLRYLRSFVFSHIKSYATPISLNYYWGFGSLLGIMMVIQVVTGVLLAMNYVPNLDLAFLSVERIMRDVPYGWLFRYLHANGASALFILLYIHMARGLFYQSYREPRQAVWNSGLVLFLLTTAAAFLGYVLPWGQMSFWGATVITNILTAVPYVGDPTVIWVWGGFAVNNATLNRFFALHFALPFVILALSGLHLAFLHRVGSSNPLALSNPEVVQFYPYFYLKDLFGLLVFLTALLSVVFVAPDFFGHPDNYIPANPLVTPLHIVPEWYFLPFYAILKSVPSKLGGAIGMGAAIGILTLLPYLPPHQVLAPWFSWGYRSLFTLFGLVLALLGWMGSLAISATLLPFLQLLTFGYFAILLFLFPLLQEVNQFVLFPKRIKRKKVDPRLVAYRKFLRREFRKNFPRTYVYKLYAYLFNKAPGYTHTLFNDYRTPAFSSPSPSLVPYTSAQPQHTGHPFHVVTPSYSLLPLFVSLAVTMTLIHGVFWTHADSTYFTPSYLQPFLFPTGEASVTDTHLLHTGTYLFILIASLVQWVVRMCAEARNGFHTAAVRTGLRTGGVLFIISEVTFFFGLFWSYFHYALNPGAATGNTWPPAGIHVPSIQGFVLTNTLLLLTSGFFVSEAHRMIYAGSPRFPLPLLWTQVAAGLFSLIQCTEWLEASFTLSSGVYGSVFYTLTGAHGFHVALGGIFLLIPTLVGLWGRPTSNGQSGFEFAAWYWHFVDVVWTILVVVLYVWGASAGAEVLALAAAGTPGGDKRPTEWWLQTPTYDELDIVGTRTQQQIDEIEYTNWTPEAWAQKMAREKSA